MRVWFVGTPFAGVRFALVIRRGGEYVKRVSKELKGSHPEIDWQRMKDFRNLVAHHYLGVDAEELWQIIKNDLPALENAIKKILPSLGYD